jgi:hypothetical protein
MTISQFAPGNFNQQCDHNGAFRNNRCTRCGYIRNELVIDAEVIDAEFTEVKDELIQVDNVAKERETP